MSPMCAPDDALSFVIVRHAEKRSDDPRDPALTDAGMARTRRLAALLAGEPVVAVYSTGYRRTRQTAAAVASVHSLQVVQYDAKLDAAALAAQLRGAHPVDTVVIVGHSNTAPGIAAALCRCEMARMDESEYDRVMKVAVAGGWVFGAGGFATALGCAARSSGVA